jgi:uncharacterized protein YlxW (UPF0749 family)
VVTKSVLATVVTAVLVSSAATAEAASKAAPVKKVSTTRTATATRAEVQDVQAQLQTLADRLNKLEAANSALQSENSDLKALVERRDAETDYLKAQTKELRQESAVAANEISKVKGADWATKVKARGDLRYRHEYIGTERVVGSGATATVEDAADRDRQRIRARIGFDATITDHVKGTLLFATGADDPRSSNQTLGTQGSRKSIGLDLAFVDWNVKPGINIVLGKQTWPNWRPGNSLFYDADYNPEGGSVRFDRGMFFGSVYGWWLSEQYNSNPLGENSDGNVIGAQVGVKFPLFGNEARVAANYYECGACKDQTSILFGNAATAANTVGNGNTVYRPNNTVPWSLKYGYDVLEIGAEVNATVFKLPFQVWANWAQNTASDVDLNTAIAAGVSLGKASNPKTWQAALWYQDIEKDALFGQFVDSDFGDGRTDSDGWVLRGAYAPVRNITIQATYFMNKLNKDVAPVSGPTYNIGRDLDYDRLQLDLNYKF